VAELSPYLGGCVMAKIVVVSHLMHECAT